jgi:hypothetical protein
MPLVLVGGLALLAVRKERQAGAVDASLRGRRCERSNERLRESESRMGASVERRMRGDGKTQLVHRAVRGEALFGQRAYVPAATTVGVVAASMPAMAGALRRRGSEGSVAATRGAERNARLRGLNGELVLQMLMMVREVCRGAGVRAVQVMPTMLALKFLPAGWRGGRRGCGETSART